jgi:hypothetical protein
MIRSLTIIGGVGFVLALVCLAGAFAIAGGPFYIGDGLRFHHTTWSVIASPPEPAENTREAD